MKGGYLLIPADPDNRILNSAVRRYPGQGIGVGAGFGLLAYAFEKPRENVSTIAGCFRRTAADCAGFPISLEYSLF
jgi:hypothetical protein